MDQYTEYIRKVIIDTITATTDKETLQLVYGLLMKSSSQQEIQPSQP